MRTDKKDEQISRRGFLGVNLALPFLPVARPLVAGPVDRQNQDTGLITMLTAEGKTVKVKREALKNAKVIDKKMSNQSLLSWLTPKGFTSK